MVPIAVIVSRSEAVVVASMLSAAGIHVHIEGFHMASVYVNSVALGHYRLTVPERQHEDASRIVADTFAHSEFHFSRGLQKAVIRLLLAWSGSSAIFIAIGFAAVGPSYISAIWPYALGSIITTPVNPQGRSDYCLALGERG